MNRLLDRLSAARAAADPGLAGVLDLFEELVYTGEITSDGRYVHHSAGPALERFIGGHWPAGSEPGPQWEARVHLDDWPAYQQFNRQLLNGETAEATYRMLGLDGVLRTLWDRARPSGRTAGGVLVEGIISDVTGRQEADARLAEVNEQFARLLDVTGEHVYQALAHPDGRVEELFQGPGADRLLGGAVPDPEMKNWRAALHPDDGPAFEAFEAALAEGKPSDVEYRLIGADGITRWVHDRAATRRRDDDTVEISGIVSDVTERRRLRTDLTNAHAALSRVVAAMDDHLYTLQVDAGGAYRTVYRGPNLEVLFGAPLTGGAADDGVWATLVHPDDHGLWRAAMTRLPEGRPIELEYRVVGLDGCERTVLDSMRPRLEADGTLYFDGVTRDITARQRLERELQSARGAAELRARTDDLTGAFNRRHFAETVTTALEQDPAGCAVLMLDADHFKQVNDLHGHAVGDAVLVELARRVSGCLRPADCMARWGGEEFVVLLCGVSSDEELDRLAQRLRSAVASSPVVAEGVSVPVTVSIGAARTGPGLDSLDTLIEAADRCLYVSKRQGRDRVSAIEDLDDAGVAASEPVGVQLARALSTTAALREGAPEDHAEQVATLATLVAEHMSLPAGIVERCRLGGWLHDVGKVAVPGRILDKPGALDDDEWAVMRTHPVVGEGVVLRVDALRGAAAAVRHHHERYDGTGYPDRLAGDAIPIEARIVAAADAFAAMTTDRVYSAARTFEEAAAELLRSGGSHLDADVVTAMLDTLRLGELPALPVA